jgi:hypothetical protein
VQISGSIEIDRPVEAVFDYMSVPENNLKWEKGVLENELTSEGPMALGSTGRRVEKNMGTDRLTWEITKYDSNEAIAMKFEGEKFKGEGGWDLGAIDTGSRLTYWFNGDPKNPIFKLILPLMRPMIHGQVRKSYTTLKELLEAEG